MNRFLTTTAALACFSVSAVAADLPRRAVAPVAPPPPIFTWTGFHVGVNAGGTFSNNSSAAVVAAPLTNNAVNPAFTTIQQRIDLASSGFAPINNRTGALLGVQAGYDYQFGTPFVLGIEVDAQGVISPGSRGLFSNVVPNNPNAVGATAIGGSVFAGTGVVQKRLDWLGTVRGRIGYAVLPSFLLYATGGLAVGGVKSNTIIAAARDFPGTNFTGFAGGYSTNRVGYTIGAGGEYMFLPNFSVKLEYLYYNLGSATYRTGLNIETSPAAGGAGYASDIAATRVRYDGHIARVGLNYHFWAPPPVAPVVARY